MNINELIERAHSQAKAMGWWDKERNTGELLMLIVSECGEALEAHRSGRLADLKSFDECMAMGPYTDDTFPIVFQGQVKDTFEDELADIVIRIADLCGSVDGAAAELPHNDINPEEYDGTDGSYNVGAELLDVVRSVERIPIGEPGAGLYAIADSCYWSMYIVFSIAEHHNIDLWRHIELKMKYNLTRGHKHGKAY